MMSLTVGMAAFDDHRGVWATVQALRLYHDADEIIVVDNNPGMGLNPDTKVVEPMGPHGRATFQFIRSLADDKVQYIPMASPVGTAPPRQRVFDEANGDIVVCMDAHVLLPLETLGAVRDYFADPAHAKDLLSGPMLYDHFKAAPSLFMDTWNAEMRGVWGEAWQCKVCRSTYPLLRTSDGAVLVEMMPPHAPVTQCKCGTQFAPTLWENHQKSFLRRGLIPVYPSNPLDSAQPFEVPGQGLGFFAMLRKSWPGFNPDFRGFGGEELYIHEKVRRAGGRNVCHPAVQWAHSFGRPEGTRYPLNRWNKVRNYVIGHRELGLPLDAVKAHFVAPGRLSEKEWDELTSGPLPSEKTNEQCGSCGFKAPDTLLGWYQEAAQKSSDINEHVPTLRALASQCEHVTEFGVRRGVSTVALLMGQPKRLVSYDVAASPEIGPLMQKRGACNFEFRIGDSRSAVIEPTDMLFIDTKHTGEQLAAELANAAGKVRRWIVLHDTETFGEVGEDGGPGLTYALRDFMRANPQWSVVKNDPKNNGLMILSQLPEDKPALPGKARMGWNYAKAVAKGIGAGKLPLEMVETRLKACDLCEFRVAEQCSICGCFLAEGIGGREGKAFYPTEDCPHPKGSRWPKVS